MKVNKIFIHSPLEYLALQGKDEWRLSINHNRPRLVPRLCSGWFEGMVGLSNQSASRTKSRGSCRLILLFLLTLLFLLALNKAAYAASWNFAVFGDTRGRDTTEGVNTTVLSAIATDIVNNRNCEFALVIGDLVYSGDYNSSFALFNSTITQAGLKVAGSSGSGVPIYTIRGNHDTTGSNALSNWFSYFSTLPQNGPSNASGGGGNSEVGLTYSFTSENALFLGLDEYRNSAQKINLDWVNTTLVNSTAQHIFVFGHEPAYQANHADCLDDVSDIRNTSMEKFYNAGGRLYFAGHDHLTAIGRFDASNASEIQRFYQVIVGAGGAPFHGFNGTYSKNNAADQGVVTDIYHDNDAEHSIPFHYGYAVVTVDSDLLWLRIYGTEPAVMPDWQLLYSLVIGGALITDTNTVSGNMTVDSGIMFNQDFDGTYSGSIGGLGDLTKAGSGNLTLSGNNTYTGTTTVDEGKLVIIGNSSSTDVTVNSDGIFGGTGPIKSLTNHGKVTPGSSVGTLDLNGGSFTQSSTGTLEIEVESTSNFDQIINVSTASLDGTLKTITSGNYTVGDTLSGIIQTSGGITGVFSFLDTYITPTMLWEPQVNGNNLDLVATSDYNNEVLKLSLTPDQKSVAAMMQLELPSAAGDLAIVKSAIDSLDTNAEVADAYSQISPEKFEGVPSVAFSNAAMQFNNLQGHMDALRTGEIRGFTFDRHTGAFRGDLLNGLLLAYEGDNLGRLVSRDSVQVQNGSDPRFFINGEGNFGDQDSTDSQPGFHYSAGGITAGLDYSFTERLIGGFNLGYTRTVSDLGGSGGKVNVDSVSCGIYGVYSGKNFYINGAGGFTSNFYDTEREIEFGGLQRKAKADTFGKQLNLFIGTGRDFHIKQLTTGPTATVKYSRLWIDSFSESGAGSLNLHIADQRAESFQLGLGWRAEYELKCGKKTVAPQVHASYQHEFSNDGRTIEARLEGGSNIFQVTTDEPTRDFALVGSGITVELTESVSFNAGYDAQVGQRDYVAQSFYGSIHFSF